MASRTYVQLFDDIDGGHADETIEFGFRGQTYEIDLAEDHIKEMAEFLSPFIEAGRKTSTPSLRSRSTRRAGGSSGQGADGQKLNYGDVRAWAKENGIEVNERGRLPQHVIDAYNAR